MKKNRPIYCTSFCNFGHYLDTGRPIGHECYIIPPRFLQMEREDKPWPEAARRKWSKHRSIVIGRKLKAD